MLLDLPEVTSLLDELRQEFEATDLSKLYPAYLSRFNLITQWEFSSGNYFHPEPFFEEQSGFKSAVLIKKKYKSVDEARWLGKYCAGFINGKHVVTVRPGQRTVNSVLATLYDEVGLVLGVRSVTFRGIGTEKMRSELGGLGRIISRQDNTKLDIGVGIGGAFSVILIQYSDDGRPLQGTMTNKSASEDSKWTYHYTHDGQLDEIRGGSILPLWKRKDITQG